LIWPEDWLRPEWRNPGVGALMTTRHGGFSRPPFDSMNLRHGEDLASDVERNRRLFAEAVGGSPVFLDQVHGRRVVRIGALDASLGAALHRVDASFTTEPGVACVVQAADCLPVLFAAPGNRGVAAAHAGWRGLAAGVLTATVEALCAAAACEASELEAWLGACIGPRHFEVGRDVLDAFGMPEHIAPGGDEAPRFVPSAEGKWLADLTLLARDRLRSAGVTKVAGGAWCTFSDPSRFFSFRRERVTGRMAAAVWIEPVGRGS
jgi:YfiH family protein